MAAIAGVALILPWSGHGTLGIQLLAPALLSVSVAWLFTDLSLRVRAALLGGLVLAIASIRICWEAIVLDGGDWSFDGERSLVAMSVAIQFFFAAIAFVSTWFVLQRRHHVA